MRLLHSSGDHHHVTIQAVVSNHLHCPMVLLLACLLACLLKACEEFVVALFARLVSIFDGVSVAGTVQQLRMHLRGQMPVGWLSCCR
jgi:hypothetical protein